MAAHDLQMLIDSKVREYSKPEDFFRSTPFCLGPFFIAVNYPIIHKPSIMMCHNLGAWAQTAERRGPFCGEDSAQPSRKDSQKAPGWSFRLSWILRCCGHYLDIIWKESTGWNILIIWNILINKLLITPHMWILDTSYHVQTRTSLSCTICTLLHIQDAQDTGCTL